MYVITFEIWYFLVKWSPLKDLWISTCLLKNNVKYHTCIIHLILAALLEWVLHYIGSHWSSENSTNFLKVIQLRNCKAWLWTHFSVAETLVATKDIYLRILLLQMSQILSKNWKGLLSFFFLSISDVKVICSFQVIAMVCCNMRGRYFRVREASWHFVSCEEFPFVLSLESQAWGQTLKSQVPVMCLNHSVEICLLVPLSTLPIPFLSVLIDLPNYASVMYYTGVLRGLKVRQCQFCWQNYSIWMLLSSALYLWEEGNDK